jgi:CRISPR-associated protein Csm5
MVWKDQVNVLDQKRIFKLLSRGPRLDSYLAQIRRAEKLDFASWGGYAQNFALRRIPLDDASLSTAFDRARPEDLFIPTFTTTAKAALYLPASLLKGALRTAMIVSRTSIAQVQANVNHAATRSAARHLEQTAMGDGGFSRTRPLCLADSSELPPALSRVYLTRTSTLITRGKGLELGWKCGSRGSVDARRVAESTPTFAEMAPPGTVFEGGWSEQAALSNPAMLHSLRWKDAAGVRHFTESANFAAERLLAYQRAYAEAAGLPAVMASIDSLRGELAKVRETGTSALVCVGWGTGYLAKAALLGVEPDQARSVLRESPVYGRQIATGLPFPKTRRYVFSGGQPVCLPGWGRVDFVKSSQA